MIVDAPVKSGRTTTSCISILQKLVTSNQQCQALILAPFPKAALRIQKTILALGGYDIQCHACIDQAELCEDSVRLGKGSPVVIGTPAYIQEIIRHGALATDDIHVFVLDGVDEMLSEGQETVIRWLFQHIPRNAQVVFLLSNTSMELNRVAKRFMRDPVCVIHGIEDIHRTGDIHGTENIHSTEEPELDDEAASGSAHGLEVNLCEIEVRCLRGENAVNRSSLNRIRFPNTPYSDHSPTGTWFWTILTK